MRQPLPKCFLFGNIELVETQTLNQLKSNEGDAVVLTQWQYYCSGKGLQNTSQFRQSNWLKIIRDIADRIYVQCHVWWAVRSCASREVGMIVGLDLQDDVFFFRPLSGDHAT